nr:IS701 family transposase [Lentibacillus kapialis]
MSSNQTHIDTTPIQGTLQDLQPLQLVMVYKTDWEPVWDQLVRDYHYLGFRNMLGARLKYMLLAGGRPVACLSFSAAMGRVTARDCFIGWSEEQKARHLPQVVNNHRFLILPWVRVHNLASYTLARALDVLPEDWQRWYHQRPLLVETYIDQTRFRGTSYQAANFIHAGQTRGFSKQGSTYVWHGRRKEVYVYPLNPLFRDIIGCEQRPFPPVRPSKKPVPPKRFEEEKRRMMMQETDWHPHILEEAGLSEEAIEQLGEELVAFHDRFSDAFQRSEQQRLGEVILKGMLSDAGNKTTEAVALRYLGEKKVRSSQLFLSKAKWDENTMQENYQQELARLLADEQGMLCVDGSDFPKKGKHSAGVARQYCGRLGKVENCQSGLFVSYASTHGYGLVDRQLYMPEKWFDDDYAKRRKRCRVPEDLQFQTKNEIALDLLRKQKEAGHFPAQWIGCDAAFGADGKFLQGVHALGYTYFADIRCNQQVWIEEPEVGLPPYKGRGRRPTKVQPLTASMSVAEVAQDPSLHWQKVTLAQGAKGSINAQVTRLRVSPKNQNGLLGEECWLYMRVFEDGTIKYAFSNASENCTMAEMNRAATMRWSIEQCFNECKSELGMDQYEMRSYVGWHRHMLYVFLAHLFLLQIRMTFKKKQQS